MRRDGAAEPAVLGRDRGSHRPDRQDLEARVVPVEILGTAISSRDRDADARGAADVVVDARVQGEAVLRAGGRRGKRGQKKDQESGQGDSHVSLRLLPEAYLIASGPWRGGN